MVIHYYCFLKKRCNKRGEAYSNIKSVVLIISYEVSLHYGNRFNQQKRQADNGRGKAIKHPLMEALK